MAKSKSEAQILENYRVALTNVERQPKIAALMAEYGYDSTKIAEGKTLLDTTRQSFDFNKHEDQETTEIRAAFDTKVEVLSSIYSSHRKKAKIIFRNDDTILKNLVLTGMIPRPYIRWVETMKTFYAGIHADADLLAKLTPLRITEADIVAALTSIVEMEKARADYLIEVGESQDATKLKDAAFGQIDDWMSDFFAVAKIAMEDRPQLLEALGLFVRS